MTEQRVPAQVWDLGDILEDLPEVDSLDCPGFRAWAQIHTHRLESISSQRADPTTGNPVLHDSTSLFCFNLLGVVYVAIEEPLKAETSFLMVMRQQREFLAVDTSMLMDVAHNLGALYLQWGRMDEATRWVRETSISRLRTLGVGHPLTQYALKNLATLVAGEQGDSENATRCTFILRAGPYSSTGIGFDCQVIGHTNEEQHTSSGQDGVLD